jgi:hypothetical protein
MNICSSDDDVQMMMRNANEAKLELGVGKGYIKLVSNKNTYPIVYMNLQNTHIFSFNSIYDMRLLVQHNRIYDASMAEKSVKLQRNDAQNAKRVIHFRWCF